MYGVPPDLDLSPFVAARLINVGVGLANTNFVFEIEALSFGNINVESLWELRGSGGEVINARSQPDEVNDAGPLHLHLILGQHVAEFILSPPKWFELGFDNGVRLRVHDDSATYESFTVEPGTWIV